MPRPKVPHPQSQVREIAEALQRERPDLDPVDYLYLIYANRAGRMLESVDDKHCRRDFGISAPEMRVLYALRRAAPSYALRPTELYRTLLITSGAITKQVDRLEKGGYVARQRGPAKSGGFLIHLTAKGLKTADEALSSLAEVGVMTSNTLSYEERAQLIGLFEKLLVGFEDRLENFKNTSSSETD